MSEIHYACPGCQSTLTVPGRAAGRTLPCPICGQKAVVPVSLPPTEVSPLPLPSCRQRPFSGCAIGIMILLAILLSVAGGWAWFWLAREGEKDHGSATPAAMSSKKGRETRYVKGRRSEDGEARGATDRTRALDKKYEDLRQKEEREQAQFEKVFQRGQQEDIEFKL